MYTGLKAVAYISGIELKEIANMIDVKPQSINSWITGKRKFPQERIDELSKILGVRNSVIEGKSELTDNEIIGLIKRSIKIKLGREVEVKFK